MTDIAANIVVHKADMILLSTAKMTVLFRKLSSFCLADILSAFQVTFQPNMLVNSIREPRSTIGDEIRNEHFSYGHRTLIL